MPVQECTVYGIEVLNRYFSLAVPVNPEMLPAHSFRIDRDVTITPVFSYHARETVGAETGHTVRNKDKTLPCSAADH